MSRSFLLALTNFPGLSRQQFSFFLNGRASSVDFSTDKRSCQSFTVFIRPSSSFREAEAQSSLE